MRAIVLILSVIFGVSSMAISSMAQANPGFWKSEGWKTNFDKAEVPLEQIMSGGPNRDGIPPIDNPKFVSVAKAELAGREPVLMLIVGDDVRAYPLSVLIWHEIVNDTVGGQPVAVTYCPLCDSAIVFDRLVDGQVLRFGTTGKLRKSDMVMWDDVTESWWQQFLGKGIVGDYAGTELTMLPSRIESFERFKMRFPNGKVLVPSNVAMRPYGANPYVGYDESPWPFLYRGMVPPDVKAMDRVVKVGDTAWDLNMLTDRRRVEGPDGLVLSWEPGQASALSNRQIKNGRDIGNMIVQRDGLDVVHDVTFTFAFHAFLPDGMIYIACDPAAKKPTPPVTYH